jgi:spore germination protein KB
MPETPLVVFVVVLAFLAANAARRGLEVVGRLSELLAPAVVSALLSIEVFSISRMDFGHLRPIFLPGGYQDLVAPVSGVFSYFTMFVVVAMLLSHLDSPRSGIVSSLAALLISGALIVVMCIAMISAFGPTTNAIVLHAFALARTASIGTFFERFEALMMVVWTTGAATTAAVFIWAAAEAIGEVFSLRTSAAIAYPLGWTVALFSLTGLNTTLRFFDFATGPWVIFSAATAILVTGLSLLIAAVDRRRETPPG